MKGNGFERNYQNGKVCHSKIITLFKHKKILWQHFSKDFYLMY
ncbi:hypothetical protein SGADD02_01508 [Streptococcus gallolyticus]|uniref:Uncharacterized protein n=1 Tax=Streptococcus gallolyticus TaxID=315405 RepID=A0A139MUA4_9STRE|nr:hypothetical protein HMPREF9352_0530 [Streptococcus gallolyticus subsp. gallolyticus TX20005]KXT67101.1 hypothetical protein SGADD02_01508 [Streptococcus gallolyticus]